MNNEAEVDETTRSATSPRAGVRSAVLIAAGILLALFLLEFTMRSSETVLGPAGMHTRGLFEEYPLEQRGEYFVLQSEYRGLLFGRPLRTDAFGFRSAPIPIARPSADELRIFLMGTCITLGEIDETTDGLSIFSRTLERELQERIPDRKVRVINAAVPGTFEAQYVDYYESVLRRFDPDIVILETGTTHIIEPTYIIEEYRARATGDVPPSQLARPRGIRERLYDFFDHSAVISQFYGFRRNKEALFRSWFWRRPGNLAGAGEIEAASLSPEAEAYMSSVLEPAAGYYRRDLARLYSALAKDGREVVAHVFPHALPRVDLEELPHQLRRALGNLEYMTGMPPTMSSEDLWQLFRYSYETATQIAREEAVGAGVHFLDLMEEPVLRQRRIYHPRYYYLPLSEASKRKGAKVAQLLLERHDLASLVRGSSRG